MSFLQGEKGGGGGKKKINEKLPMINIHMLRVCCLDDFLVYIHILYSLI